jgi:hypothetical protein
MTTAFRISRQLLLVITIVVLNIGAAAPPVTPESMRSPVNQVFQFMQPLEYHWSDGTVNKPVAYLWIPEACTALRGLLILGNNVPEHMLVGNPKIRAVCAKQNLGIVWCTPSFLNTKPTVRPENVKCVQKLLDGLAGTCGYPEVATVPWIPIGESGHLLMVDALVENSPDRCIAGIWLKNNHIAPHNRTVPDLTIFGSAQEWGQDKGDITAQWNNVGKADDGIRHERANHPDWALTYFIDGWSGHFDCSERLVDFIANYIDQVATARIPDKSGDPLKPIDISSGYVADLPLPGREPKPPQAVAKLAEKDRALPWFFDRASAEAAQAVSRINWSAQTQLTAFANEKGDVFPFTFNGISWMNLNQKPEAAKKTQSAEDAARQPILTGDDDGITFTVNGVLLEKPPENFAVQNVKLATTPGTPVVEWLCGPVEPLGNNRFRVAIDRTWPSPLYLAVRQPGTDSVRGCVQPGQIARGMNTEGAPQKITFPSIEDVRAGIASVQLKATADSGLPVRYFVEVGPATIDGDRLVFTPIPPKARYPITVVVGAWQWGRWTQPRIKRADIVKQTFRILPADGK